MDWAYARQPVSEICYEAAEVAVHRRLCALIESQLDVLSAEEDSWSHLFVRVAACCSLSSGVSDWFVARESWLYKKRLDASMASAPLIDDENASSPWLCGRRPRRLARLLGARASPAGDVFSMRLVHGSTSRKTKRRKRDLSLDWADCGDALARRLVRMDRGMAAFDVEALFYVAGSRFERCLRSEVSRTSALLQKISLIELFPSESRRICRLVARTRAAVEKLSSPNASLLPRKLPTLRSVDFDALILKKKKRRRAFVHNNDDTTATRLPPCMTRMHVGLLRTHHLRHHARFQFATFLKSLGMSYAQVRELWHSEYAASNAWSKRWEVYEKQLRNLFEKNKDPTGRLLAHTCDAGMSKKSPTPRRSSGEFHGCPFRFDTVADLEDLCLNDMGMAPKDVDDVLSAAKKKTEEEEQQQPGVLSRERRCCAKAFAALHPTSSSSKEEGNKITRPADWVYSSFKIVPQKPEEDKEEV